jgi:hypothetical protein
VAGRIPRWLLLIAVAASGCAAHAAAPAGAQGKVGPQSQPPVPVVAPLVTPSESAATVSGSPQPPSTVYGVAPDGALLPAEALTPGVADPKVTVTQLCRPGYVSSARTYSTGTQYQIFADYGVSWHERAAYRVDLLIPLSLGGLPEHRNLWPVPLAGPHGVTEKDGVEAKLRQLVCSGKLPLTTAQQVIATNWFTAKERYGSAVAVPVVVTGSTCPKVGLRGVNKYAQPMICASLVSGKRGWILSPPQP